MDKAIGVSEEHEKLLISFLRENDIAVKEVLEGLDSFYRSETVFLTEKLEKYYRSRRRDQKTKEELERLLDLVQLKLFNTNMKQLEV